jgi:hypothetical protein
VVSSSACYKGEEDATFYKAKSGIFFRLLLSQASGTGTFEY